MSRWTFGIASLVFLAFSLPAAAQGDDLPRNVELKPGAATTEGAAPADKSAAETSAPSATTRQIVTEGKDAAPAADKGAATPQVAPAGAAATPADKAVKPGPAAATAAPAEDAPNAGAPAAETVQGAPAPEGLPGPGEIVVAVQTELKRVGCDPGEIDGVWGGRSREALAAFGHFAKVDVADLLPTPDVLVIIKGKGAPVCQIAAAPPEGDEAAPPAAAETPAPHGHQGYDGGGYGGGYGGGGGY